MASKQRVHGITIDLDVNTSAINESFKDINKSISSTQSELKQVDKLLKFDPKSTTLLAQKQVLLSEAIEETQNKLVLLAKAKQQADQTDGIDRNSKAYRDLERDIERTKQQLENFTKQSNEATKSAEDLNIKVDDTSESFISSGADLGGLITTFEFFIDVAKKVGDALVGIVKDSTSFADDVNALSQQYNLSTKEIQQYKLASDLIDVEFETIAKSMSKLTKNMTSTSTGVVGAFKKLGVATKDSSGQLRDSNEVFNEVIAKLGEIENETEQDSLALELFGKSSAELGSLINGGAEQLADFNKYLEENNLLLSQNELDELNNVQDGFDTLSATIETIKRKVALELAPVLEPIVKGLNQFILDNKDYLIKLADRFAEMINDEKTQEIFDEFEDLSDILKDIIDGVIDFEEKTGLLRETALAVLEVFEIILRTIKMIVDLLNGDFIGSEEYNRVANQMQNYVDPSHPYGSRGFGALQSGGYGNNITLNASFVANGSLNEEQAMRFADIMTQRINENLGREV